jgi:hypothetical protein
MKTPFCEIERGAFVPHPPEACLLDSTCGVVDEQLARVNDPRKPVVTMAAIAVSGRGVLIYES